MHKRAARECCQQLRRKGTYGAFAPLTRNGHIASATLLPKCPPAVQGGRSPQIAQKHYGVAMVGGTGLDAVGLVEARQRR